MKKQLYFLLAAIGFNQLILNFTNFAIITNAAMTSSDLSKVGFPVLITALGTFAALILSVIERRLSFDIRQIQKVAAFIQFISMIVLSLVFNVTGVWQVAYFVFILCSSRTIAGQMADISILQTERVAENNKAAQLTATAAMLTGISIAPIAVSYLQMKALFLPAALSALMYLLYAISTKTIASGSSSPFVKSEVVKSSSWKITPAQLNIYMSLFFVWITGGVFHVIEVPILKQRFDFAAEQISLVFLVGIVANLGAIYLFNLRNGERNKKTHFVASSILCVVIAPFYAMNNNFSLVFIAVFAYGAANGIFNLIYTSMIQEFESHEARTQGFLFARFTISASLLLSALACSFISLDQVIELLKYTGAVFGLILVVVYFSSKSTEVKNIFEKVAIVFVFLFVSKNVSAQEIRVLLPEIPKSPYPSKILDSGSALVSRQIFQNLYSFDSNNFIVPVLVKSQTWSNKFKKLTIQLNTNIKFSDGEALSADIVRKSLTGSLKEMGKSGRWAGGQIEGFDNFIEGKSTHISGIVVKGLGTLEFRFNSENPTFLQILATPYFGIFKDGNGKYPLGTGHYYIESTSDVKWKLKALSSDIGIAKGIEFTDSAHSDRSNLDFSFVPLDSQSELVVNEYPYLLTVVLIFNTKSDRLKDPNIRCYIARNVTEAFQKSDYRWVPIDVGLQLSWSLKFATPKNRDAVKITSDMKAFDLIFANSAATFNSQYNIKIKDGLKKKSINLNFRELTISSSIAALTKPNFEIAMLGFVPDFPHADALLTPFVGSDQQYNFTGYSNRKLDSLLKHAKDSPLKENQLKLYNQAFSIISDDCPVSFLGTQKGKFWSKSGVKISKFSSLGYHNIDFSTVSWR